MNIEENRISAVEFLGNLRKSLQHLEKYKHIHCFLDNDLAGRLLKIAL